MNKKAIFIHSLFRTGSTYIWSKFRKNRRYYCYYEPFHQDLAVMSREHPVIWSYDKKSTDQMGHPALEKDHLFEYRKFYYSGCERLPFFKKSFSFDEYFNNGDNPDLKKYIDYLIKLADNKTPVLKFCRTAHRAQWFKNHYPDSANIYIFRDPRHQWQSYFEMQTRNNRVIFQVMDLIVASKNMELPLLKPVSDEIPLFKYHSERFRDEEEVYNRLIHAYSYRERYVIFYFLWFKSFLENLFNADLMLSIDGLSEDSHYREEIYDFLRGRGIDGVNFNDSQIRYYTDYVLETGTMEKIETGVQQTVLKTLSSQQADRFFRKLSAFNNDFLRIDRHTLFKADADAPADKKDISGENKNAARYEHMVRILADWGISLQNELCEEKRNRLQVTKDKENAIKKYEAALKNREQKIDELHNNPLGKLGNLMTRIKKNYRNKKVNHGQ